MKHSLLEDSRNKSAQKSFYKNPNNHPSAQRSLYNDYNNNKTQKSQRQNSFQKSRQSSFIQRSFPASRSTNLLNNAPTQQYEMLVQYELKRQRQKNRILQERLHNKQIFIVQLTEVQNQLASAFERCQIQLEYFKRGQIPRERQYLQEINELKHLVIRLEDKINEYQKRQTNRYNSLRSESQQRKHPSKKSHQRPNRSKTTMNNDSPQYKKQTNISQYINEHSSRISNFINQFMAMANCFNKDIKAENVNIKKKLKMAWKWIKGVVAEWCLIKKEVEIYENLLDKLKDKLLVEDSELSQQANKIMIKLRL